MIAGSHIYESTELLYAALNVIFKVMSNTNWRVKFLYHVKFLKAYAFKLMGTTTKYSTPKGYRPDINHVDWHSFNFPSSFV